MTEWGFYCDVESGRLLDNPYIFPIHQKEQKEQANINIQIIYCCITCIILIPFIAFL